MWDRVTLRAADLDASARFYDPMAFPAADRAAVDAFHRAALAAGYRDNGAPGERPG